MHNSYQDRHASIVMWDRGILLYFIIHNNQFLTKAQINIHGSVANKHFIGFVCMMTIYYDSHCYTDDLNHHEASSINTNSLFFVI